MRSFVGAKKKSIILSYGCSGSYWLGQSLHKLDNVFCSTGTDHPLTGIRYWHNQSEFNSLVDLIKKDNKLGKYGFSPLKVLYNQIPLSSYYYLHDQSISASQRVENHHNIILDEIEMIAKPLKPNATHLISVHGLNVETYLASKYAKKSDIKIFDLIRHPVTRSETWIKSFMWTWENCKEGRSQLEQRRDHSWEKLKEYSYRYDVDFDNPLNLMTYFVYEHNFVFVKSLAQLKCKRITFEDLKSKPEVFSELYTDLFEEQPDKKYLDFVYSTENLSSGRASQKESDRPPLSANEQFEAWTPFQQIIFIDLMKSLDYFEAYAPYNYDFSFAR